MDIYLIRHGETIWNKERRLQGTADIPLDDYGIELAEKTAEGLKDIPFDRIYTSPLIRARRTAEIIRGSRPIEIVEAPELMEIRFGKYEGQIVDAAHGGHPSPDLLRFFQDPERYAAPPGGESLRELRERTSSFVKRIAFDPANAGLTILMASHGAAIRSILSGLFDLPLADFWKGSVHKNCGVTKLSVRDGQLTLEFENRTFY